MGEQDTKDQNIDIFGEISSKISFFSTSDINSSFPQISCEIVEISRYFAIFCEIFDIYRNATVVLCFYTKLKKVNATSKVRTTDLFQILQPHNQPCWADLLFIWLLFCIYIYIYLFLE